MEIYGKVFKLYLLPGCLYPKNLVMCRCYNLKSKFSYSQNSFFIMWTIPILKNCIHILKIDKIPGGKVHIASLCKNFTIKTYDI